MNHLADVASAHGHRVLSNRKKPKTTTVFSQIIVGPSGVSVVERLEPGVDAATTTAGLLRRIESVAAALPGENVEVRAILIQQGSGAARSRFGVDVVENCPGWMFTASGPLDAPTVARVAARLGDTFPAAN